MQRWKCAVGAIVVLAIAGGSVAGCNKSGGKQDAAQAKAKPDPKAKPAKAANSKPAAKTGNAQPAAKTANAQPAAKPAAPAANTAAQKPQADAAAKPAQTAAAAKTPAPNAPAPKAAPSTPAQKPAQTAATAAAKPAPATPTPKPAPTAVATAKPTSDQPKGPAQTTVASGDLQSSLQANKALVAQLQSRLPAGTDVMKASDGFRNLNHFVSAVHASHNLTIPFDKMRTAMVDEKKSLSAAIKVLKPSASATIEAQRADYDARGTIYQSQHPDTPAADSTDKKPAADSTARKAKPSTASGVQR